MSGYEPGGGVRGKRVERDWSAYQRAVFADVATGEGHTVVRARAGSGKTSTIVEAFEHVPAGMSVLMCAFNKAIADELSRRAPVHVDVKTLHGYGLAQVSRALGRVNVDKANERVAKLAKAYYGEEYKTLDRRKALAACVSLAKGQLVDTAEGVARLADAFGLDSGDTDGERADFAGHVLAVLEACRDPQGVIGFDDMVWLPVALDLRCAQYDRVFVDETQDLNAAQVALALRACKPRGRILAVGDDRQCHPAGTMIRTPGGDVAVEDLREGDEVVAWSQKSQKLLGKRFVTGTAVRPYTGKMIRLGTGEHSSVDVTPNHKLVVRWTTRATDNYCTYLMWRRGFGFRVGWCQVFDKNRAFHAGQRARLEKADKFWILKVFKSRTEASVHESIVAGRYGIPTITFEPVHGATHLTEKTIRQVFAALAMSNQERGEKCLADHGREFDLHLFPYPSREGAAVGRRTIFQAYACNIIPGYMAVPSSGPEPGAWTRVRRVSRRHFDENVYSLGVSPDATYVADGVVVHNCIYQFRGAGENSMRDIIDALDAKVLPLSVTYRCARSIVAEANRQVPDLEAAPGAPEGTVEHADEARMVREAREGDFILSRINAPLVRLCLAFLREGRRANIQGRDVGAQLAALVRKAKASSVAATLMWVDEWASAEADRLARKELDASGPTDKAETLRVIAEGASSVAEVIDRIDRLFRDDDDAGRITLSSTHKAKGLERERAWVLADTYLRRPGVAEGNLFYVAVSRAKTALFLVRKTRD
jgi:hypothetical protein